MTTGKDQRVLLVFVASVIVAAVAIGQMLPTLNGLRHLLRLLGLGLRLSGLGL